MKLKIKLFLLLVLVISTTEAQTYIGQILHRNTYEYAKLVCQNDSCRFSIPYVDGDRGYSLPLDIAAPQSWTITRNAATWNFKTQIRDEMLIGTIQTPAGQQEISFFEQKPPIVNEKLAAYEGVYKDQNNRRVIIYTRFNYLHIISPYSEETMSLKPIGDNLFWSVSGEKSTFSSFNGNHFERLTITKGHETFSLERQAPYTVEDLWIPVMGDTLYAKLFLPSSEDPVPGCLVLPGGGAIGMENYLYEARLFAAHGMAALLFDKSGNGKSKGEGHFHYQSFEDKNEQYKALFRYLQNHPKVDPSKTGVHGPSEGARIGMMMAIDLGKELAFAIAIAGPYMTLREGQLYAMDHHHRNMGVKQSDNMKIQQIWNAYYDGIVKGEIEQSTIDAANVYRNTNDRLFLPPDGTELPVSPHEDDIENDRTVKEAGKIVTPILFQYGENDQRVDMNGSLRNLIPQLTHRDEITTIVYPRGGHNIMTPEYKICTGYTSDKINWLKHLGIIE